MLIHNIVRQGKYNTIDELLSYIKNIGKRLVEANPKGEIVNLGIPRLPLLTI